MSNNPSIHFVDTNKMIAIGNGARKYINDYRLTRYACSLEE